MTPSTPGIHHVTRTEPARRIYDLLRASGVTATRMVEYRAPVGAVTGPVTGADAPRPGEWPSTGAFPPEIACYAVGTPATAPEWVRDAAGGSAFDAHRSVDLGPDDALVLAATGDEPVGRAVVSPGGETPVAPLGSTVDVPGAYVRRVYVRPDWRGRGVATGLLGVALSVSPAWFDTTTATALVAADNRPSRGLFESCGFTAVRAHDYLRVGPFEWRRTTPCDADGGAVDARDD